MPRTYSANPDETYVNEAVQYILHVRTDHPGYHCAAYVQSTCNMLIYGCIIRTAWHSLQQQHMFSMDFYLHKISCKRGTTCIVIQILGNKVPRPTVFHSQDTCERQLKKNIDKM